MPLNKSPGSNAGAGRDTGGILVAGSSVSGRAALVAAIPRQWMVFPQLQIGARQVLDMATEATGIVLFDPNEPKGE